MKQWEMAKKFADDDRVRFFIGDVRDKDRLHRAMAGLIMLSMLLPQKLFQLLNIILLSV